MNATADTTGEARPTAGGRWARSAPARAVRSGILRGLLAPAVRSVGPRTVSGLEHLADLEGPVIFAANHSSHMDAPAVLLSLPPRVRRRTLVLAAADYFYRNRLVGAALSLGMGTVPVERNRPSWESIRAAAELLSEGWNLLVFPEGTRSRDGRLYRGKTGVARIALETGVPVVPVGIRGTFQALPHGRRLPRRARVEVRFGRPLRFDRFRDRPIDRFVLRSVTDEIMYEIMLLSGQDYVDEYASRPAAAPPVEAPPSESAPAQPGRRPSVRRDRP